MNRLQRGQRLLQMPGKCREHARGGGVRRSRRSHIRRGDCVKPHPTGPSRSGHARNSTLKGVNRFCARQGRQFGRWLRIRMCESLYCPFWADPCRSRAMLEGRIEQDTCRPRRLKVTAGPRGSSPRKASDSAFVVIYTISAFFRRGRPDSPLVRIATAHASTDWGSTTKSSVRSGASSRREQPSLPTLAGLEFIVEDVASHDGSLSTSR